MTIPAIPFIAGAAVLAVVRPSNIVRGAENVVIGTGKLIARGATGTVHGAKRAVRVTQVEFKARQIEKAQRAIAEEVEALRSMSPEDRRELAAMQTAVLARAEELRLQREAEQAERDMAKHRAEKLNEIDAKLEALREELIARL